MPASYTTTADCRGKRSAADAIDNDHVLPDAKRQKAWLSRATTDAQPKSRRPLELHRATARKWNATLDVKLQKCSLRRLGFL